MKRTLFCLTNVFALWAGLAVGQETKLVPPPQPPAAVPAPAVVAPRARAIPEEKPTPAVSEPAAEEPAMKPAAAKDAEKPAKPPGPAGTAEAKADPSQPGELVPRESWQLEISFRPNQAIQTMVFGLPSEAPAKPWHFHKLERGMGPLHLEYQELRVTVPPKALGRALTADEINLFIKQNLSEFMDPANATVTPRAFDDRWRMLSKSALGAVFNFEFLTGTPDKCCMVVSDQTVDRWALTSIYAGIPGTEDNRVAGTRWIGISNLDRRGPFSIFTKAALRALEEPVEESLQADTALWTGFLNKIKAWVESLDGKAELVATPPPIKQDWETIRFTHFSPLEKWKDIDGAWEVKETRDTKKRFRIEIHEGMSGATLIERAPSGREITRDTRLSGAGPNAWVLTREQDAELLDFLGVAPALAQEALGANPPPSTLTITRKGDSLVATWKGIMIQTNGQNKLDRIITKSRPYEMAPAK